MFQKGHVFLMSHSILHGASLVARWLNIRLPVQETQIGSLVREDPLGKEMAIHSSIFAWEIP